MPRTTRNDEDTEPIKPGRSSPPAGAAPTSLAARQPDARAGRGRSTAGGAASPTGQDAGPSSPAPKADAQPQAMPSYDDVARRAYEHYQRRGGGEGQEVDDWLRAEAELREGRGRRDDEK